MTAITAETACNHLKEPVFFVDATRTLTFGNDRFFDITDLSREEVIGKRIDLLERFMQDDFEPFSAALEEVLERKAAERRLDVTMHHPEAAPVARTLPAETRLVAVEQEATVGALVTLRDISDRVEYEQQLEEKTEQLLVLNRLLRHDISNDIAVIEGWAKLLTEESEGPARERIDRIRSAAARIRELIDETSGVLQIFRQGGEMERKPMALGDVLLNEVEKVRRIHPEVTVSTPAEEAILEVEVCANELLGSVFSNVLVNAIVHNDSENPRVEVDVEQRGDDAVVRIADNGPGIPPERREALLDEDLQRLDGVGSSIGLYLVARLVEAFGGDISIADSEPRGTAFTIELPIAGGAT